MSDEVLAAFAAESVELLEGIEDAVLRLESGGGDAIDRLFRCVHTLKGSAGIVGLGRLEDLAHRLEDRISLVREGSARFGKKCVSILLSARDRFSLILSDTSGAAQADAGDLELLASLDEAMAASESGGVPLPVPDPVGTGFSVPVGLSPESESAAPSGNTAALNEPSPRTIAAPEVALSAQVPASKRGGQSVQAAGEAYMRVQGAKLEKIFSQASGMVVTLSNLGQAIRSAGDPGIVDQVSSLETMAAALYRSVLETRMVPFGDVAGRYARAVEEIAVATGKKIRFELSGADTEIDKSLADRLSEPLLHLVRNSADHGIEMPEARVLVGKPEQGLVSLRARRESGLLTIRIEDDGSGVDPESVIKRAVASGLLGPDDKPDEDKVMELLFEPGFSMSGSVTRWSGRGVGLDVVKRSVAALRGRVRMESRFGKGSAVIVRLPLALSLVEGFIARVGELVLLVPYDVASRCKEAGPRELGASIGACRLVDVGGRLVPAIDLGLLYGEGSAILDAEAIRVAILIEDGTGETCLIVDSVGETISAAVRPLDRSVAESPGVAGTAAMGDGSLVLVLDSAELCRMALRGAASWRETAPGPTAASGPLSRH